MRNKEMKRVEDLKSEPQPEAAGPEGNDTAEEDLASLMEEAPGGEAGLTGIAVWTTEVQYEGFPDPDAWKRSGPEF